MNQASLQKSMRLSSIVRHKPRHFSLPPCYRQERAVFPTHLNILTRSLISSPIIPSPAHCKLLPESSAEESVLASPSTSFTGSSAASAPTDYRVYSMHRS